MGIAPLSEQPVVAENTTSEETIIENNVEELKENEEYLARDETDSADIKSTVSDFDVV